MRNDDTSLCCVCMPFCNHLEGMNASLGTFASEPSPSFIL